MLHEIVHFILDVLSGKKTEEEEAAARNLAPSFGQMGEAIDGLIGALSHVQLDGEEAKEEKTALSDEHQIVLSCCWLNLKVRCYVQRCRDGNMTTATCRIADAVDYE